MKKDRNMKKELKALNINSSESNSSGSTEDVTAPRSSRRISMGEPISYTNFLPRPHNRAKYEKIFAGFEINRPHSSTHQLGRNADETVMEEDFEERLSPPIPQETTVKAPEDFMRNCDISGIDASEMSGNSRMVSTPTKNQPQLEEIPEGDEDQDSTAESIKGVFLST